MFGKWQLLILRYLFWQFQIKIKFRKKIRRQGSVWLPDADFFWIILWTLSKIKAQNVVFLHKFKHYLNFYFLLKIIMRWAWHLYIMVKMINWTLKFWNSCDLKWPCLGDIYVWSGNQIRPIKLSWSKYNEIVLGPYIYPDDFQSGL